MKVYLLMILCLILISCTGSNKIELSNGCVYEGSLKNKKPDGFGSYKCGDSISYIGEWQKGQRNGFGVQIRDDGYRYEGYFVDGKESGFGKCLFPNGDFYEGFSENRVLNGIGTYIRKDDYIYTGSVKNNHRHGWGILIYTNSGIYDRYLGYFSQDSLDRIGIFVFKNKEFYIGEFAHQQFEGKGIYTHDDGRVEMGIWKDGDLIKFCDSCVSFPNYEKSIYKKYYEPFLK